MAQNFADNSAGFIQLVAEQLRQAVSQGLGGGNSAAEKTAFAALASTVGARLTALNAGFVVSIVGSQLTATSPAGAWTLALTFTAN